MKEEKYTNRIEGYCRCGCKTKIIKFENSNLSIFKHNHRFTTENDIHKCTNIFRCSSCKDMIENSFITLQEAAKLETEITVKDYFEVKSKIDAKTFKDMLANPDHSLADVYSKKIEAEMQVFYDSQKELIDLQIENKQLKERINEIKKLIDKYEKIIENSKTLIEIAEHQGRDHEYHSASANNYGVVIKDLKSYENSLSKR